MTESSLVISRKFSSQAFRRFVIPAFISNFSLAVGAVADCLFVGMKMGTAGLSAIAIGIPVYLFYNIISYSFSIGGAIHYSTELANGHPAEGNALFNNILKFLITCYVLTAALGILFLPQLLRVLGADPAEAEVYALAERYVRTQLMAVPILYLQGPFYYFLSYDGASKLGSLALTVSNVLDVAFNFIFIVLLNQGPEGSVWSTAIGAAVMLAISSLHFIRKEASLQFGRAKFEWRPLADAFQTGFSTTITYAFQFITTILANNYLTAHYGADGTAVFDVIYNLALFTGVIGESMEMAIHPMVTSYLAERNYQGVRDTMRNAMKSGTFLAFVEILIFAFLGSFLCRIFGLTGEGISLGTKALLLYCIAVIPEFWNSCVIYFDQAADRERSAYLLTTLRRFLFWLLGYALLFLLGDSYYWYILPFAEILTFLAVLAGNAKRVQANRPKDGEEKFEAILTSTGELGAKVEEFQNICEKWGCSMQQSYYGSLVLEELCASILTDAEKNGLKDISIHCSVLHSSEEITLFIRDDSIAFNPFELGQGEDAENELAIGVNIVRKKAKEFYYRRYQGFNTLVVRL